MTVKTITVRYLTSKTLADDLRSQISMGGLLLRTDIELEQFAPVALCIETPAGYTIELKGQVVQVVENQGLAVQFDDGCSEAIAELEQKARDQAFAGEEAGPGPDPVISETGQGQAQEETPEEEDDGDIPLHERIKNMSVAEKRRSALHGRKQIRLLLIRDRNKTIHRFVINNPAITLDEIEQIAKMPSVNPDVLRTIAKSKEWNRSATVCRNLVRNPKTPMKEALMLLKKLPKNEIRALAKSNNVRTPIQQAARKKALA